ncbi:MAG: phosphatidylserine decarboxylase [Bacteroidales bacterium]|nr:phosphatidylserine decarboxylase [Bacteroidales bacterium]
MSENPELEQLLIRSIEVAKDINPDTNTNPAQSLEKYFRYLNWSVKAMPWNALPGAEQIPSLFDAIDQSLNYFYWILDQPLPELEGRGFYFNSLQYVPELQPWIVAYVRSWGEYLSTEESWNSEYYALMRQEERFNLDKGWYEDPSNWRTWNDFFSRALSSPAVRPIAAPDDNSVVISPADSEPQGIWKIDAKSQIVLGVQIKSTEFQSVPLLLGGDSKYGRHFANGTLTHTFLNVHDYHRFHFPVSGTIKEVQMIPAQDALGGKTVWDATTGRYLLIVTDPGWQTIETRGLVVIETSDYGHVAVLPVGMSQISSVVFEDSVVVGAQVRKGDLLGRFLFGGSDIVMIFEKRAGFEITVPAAGDVHEHVQMGQEYGRFRR